MSGAMRVMPTNNTGAKVREMAAAYPHLLGHLMGPGGWRTPFLPYALDNGAFPAWKNGQDWDVAAFWELCEQAREHERNGGESPLWVVVPDVVGNKDETLKRWHAYAPDLRAKYGWPLAFAVQDGMHEHDVPKGHDGAEVVFVGGTTEWKWKTASLWGYTFPRVHIGRVNSYNLLWRAYRAGAESCDGTGWFRGDKRQLAGLEQFLKEWTQGHRQHPQMLLLPMEVHHG